MADLSAVLRKTIDGMSGATPQLRARVYDKARAAIARQIEAADPPLSESVITARRAAIEDAIARTEAHYQEQEQEQEPGEDPVAPPPAFEPAPPIRAPQPPLPPQRAPAAAAPFLGEAPASTPRAQPPVQSTPPPQPAAARPSPPQAPPTRPPVVHPPAAEAQPVFRAERHAPPGAQHVSPVGPGVPRDPPMGEPRRPDADAFAARPFAVDPGDRGLGERGAGDRDDIADEIPPPDVEAPRYVPPRKRGRGRSLLTGLGVLLLLGGAGAAAWTYRDQIEALLVAPARPPAESVAGTQPPGALPPETAGPATPAGTTQPPAPAETEIAALPGLEDAPTDAEPALPGAEPAPPGVSPQPSGRRFTQRLLPDGTEVDEGPGAGNSNAFDEGTNIAAASPPSEAGPITPGLIPAPGEAEIAALPEATPPSAVPDPASEGPPPAVPEAGEQIAALPPAAPGVAVAQKAVFYEERSAEEPGTQQGGNVVWSVVNEPPAEGQPPEPAIRAVAQVPEEGISLTMTIRRNADQTLPASHVIELLFDVPANFGGGQIANVQRLALKPTEDARGEPLIGVAGKISDGFFIIALNNLEQAIESNVDLLSTEQWIDIPLAYATGRRALMSIEKGIPGERAFKEAMDAWAAKT